MIPTRTLDSIRETQALETWLARATTTVHVEFQMDDGSWVSRGFADEKTAAWEEQRAARRGTPTRRAGV